MAGKLGSVFGFEDADVDGGEEAIVLDSDTNDAVAEVVEDGDAISEASDEIEATSADTEVLEKIEAVIAEAEESGEGLTPDAAAIANVAVEAIRIRMGAKGGMRALAVENFGQKGDRLSSTRLALEGIGEQIKNAWAAVLKFVEKVWNAVKEFFVKIFDAAERLKASAKKMKKYLDDKLQERERDAKVKDFDDASLAGKLAMDSTAIDASKVVKAIKVVDGLVVDVTATTATYTDALDKLVSKTGAFITKGEANFTGGDKGEFKKAQASVTDVIKAQAKNMTLPGGSFIEAKMDGTKISIKVTGSKQVTNSKISIGTETELKGICDDVLAMAEKLTSMRKANEAVAKSSKLIADVLKKAASVDTVSVNGNTDAKTKISDFKEAMKEARKVITNSSSCMQSLVQKFPTEAVKVGHAALKYVSKCVTVGYAHKFEKSDA